MTLSRVLTLSLLLAAAAPAAARADVFLVPFVGVNFAGDSGKELEQGIDAERLNAGVSLGYMGGGIFGMEGDFGYSPDFFGKTDEGGSRVTTLMGNLLLGVPLGGQSGFGVRPYGVVGLGLIQTSADAFPALDLDESDLGWNFGGGVMLFFGPVGVRADVRYFQSFSALNFLGLDTLEPRGKLDFARGSAGFIIRF